MTGIAGHRLLSAILGDPHLAGGLDVRGWERLVWQSRAAEMMGQLHRALDGAGVLPMAPRHARLHLDGAGFIARRHADAVRHELRGLQEVLEPLGIPVILLKGAAYGALGHRASVARIFNDIDILVPKQALPQVEERLSWAGWFPTHTNPYDERYYREWMHEIPPLEHKNRATALDVHFTILPPTSGIRPNPEDFFAAAEPLTGEWSFFKVLCQQDRVIHSACHLFFGEFHKGLRDLFDLHLLLEEMAVDPGSWRRLFDRADRLGLGQPLVDALQQAHRIYKTGVPDSVLAALPSRATTRWPGWLRAWMFEHGLRPDHASADGLTTPLARRLIFIRSHWLRMPLPLLAYHLFHKLHADP